MKKRAFLIISMLVLVLLFYGCKPREGLLGQAYKFQTELGLEDYPQQFLQGLDYDFKVVVGDIELAPASDVMAASEILTSLTWDYLDAIDNIVIDNCPDIYNPDQADSDGDGFGDLCDYECNVGDIIFQGETKTYTVEGLEYEIYAELVGVQNNFPIAVLIINGERLTFNEYEIKTLSNGQRFATEYMFFDRDGNDYMTFCFIKEVDETENCRDSDGGKNYFKKGETFDAGATSPWTDTCQDEKTLTEHWCENNRLAGAPFECPDACVEGACTCEKTFGPFEGTALATTPFELFDIDEVSQEITLKSFDTGKVFIGKVGTEIIAEGYSILIGPIEFSQTWQQIIVNLCFNTAISECDMGFTGAIEGASLGETPFIVVDIDEVNQHVSFRSFDTMYQWDNVAVGSSFTGEGFTVTVVGIYFDETWNSYVVDLCVDRVDLELCEIGGYRCEKDENGTLTGWAQKCYDSSVGWENVVFCEAGCDPVTGQCVETAGLPDLVVTGVILRDIEGNEIVNPVQYIEYRLSVIVKNAGTAIAKAPVSYHVNDVAYLVTDNDIPAGAEIESAAIAYYFSGINLKEITYDLDPSNFIQESNEENNLFVKSYNVAPFICTDTDGKDINVKGKVTALVDTVPTAVTFEDKCLDSTNIREYYCVDQYHADILEGPCQYGCSDGACIGAPAQADFVITVGDDAPTSDITLATDISNDLISKGHTVGSAQLFSQIDVTQEVDAGSIILAIKSAQAALFAKQTTIDSNQNFYSDITTTLGATNTAYEEYKEAASPNPEWYIGCSDWDGEGTTDVVEPFEQVTASYVTSGGSMFSDYCESEGYLQERTCKYGYPSLQRVQCGFGCQDNACRKSPKPITSVLTGTTNPFWMSGSVTWEGDGVQYAVNLMSTSSSNCRLQVMGAPGTDPVDQIVPNGAELYYQGIHVHVYMGFFYVFPDDSVGLGCYMYLGPNTLGGAATGAVVADEVLDPDGDGFVDRIPVFPSEAYEASEIVDPANENLIVIGSPCTNSVAAELLGNPEQCDEGIEPGTGYIKLLEQNGHYQLLVYGYSDFDTRMAAKVLSEYKYWALMGDEVHVIATSEDKITIKYPEVVEEFEPLQQDIGTKNFTRIGLDVVDGVEVKIAEYADTVTQKTYTVGGVVFNTYDEMFNFINNQFPGYETVSVPNLGGALIYYAEDASAKLYFWTSGTTLVVVIESISVTPTGAVVSEFIGDEFTPFDLMQTYLVLYSSDVEEPIEVPAAPEEYECTDTDGGLYYYTKGTVTGSVDPSSGVEPVTRPDYCVDLEGSVSGCYGLDCKLVEGYCRAEDGAFASKAVVCPGGCEDGGCLPYVLEEDCSDSDMGSEFIKGVVYYYENDGYIGQVDTCRSGSAPVYEGPDLVEYSCTDGVMTSQIIVCTNGCFDGACVMEAPITEFETVEAEVSGDSGILRFTNPEGDLVEIPVVLASLDDVRLGRSPTSDFLLTESEGLFDCDFGSAAYDDCEGTMLLYVSADGDAHVLELTNIDNVNNELDMFDMTTGLTYSNLPLTLNQDIIVTLGSLGNIVLHLTDNGMIIPKDITRANIKTSFGYMLKVTDDVVFIETPGEVRETFEFRFIADEFVPGTLSITEPAILSESIDYVTTGGVTKGTTALGIVAAYYDDGSRLTLDLPRISVIPEECIDSDGIDYYVAGKVTFQGQASYDECNQYGAFGSQANMLWEVTCVDGQASGEWFDCPYGCLYGACIDETVAHTCDDTDGNDANTPGSVTFDGQTFTDECRDMSSLIGADLVEYYCSSMDTLMTHYYDCPESCANGACVPFGPISECGNGICEPDESPLSCPVDCAEAVCGNKECEPGETPENCPVDCILEICGNGYCRADETIDTCPADCTPLLDVNQVLITTDIGDYILGDARLVGKEPGVEAYGAIYRKEGVPGSLQVVVASFDKDATDLQRQMIDEITEGVTGGTGIVRIIDGNKVYVREDREIAFWTSGTFTIFIEYDYEYPEVAISAYLAKYASDFGQLRSIVSLKEGWNLVSLPVFPIDNSVRNVFQEVIPYIEKIYYYEPDQWMVFNPDPTKPSNLLNLELGKGYWIKATRDIAFEVKGTRGILTSDGVEQAPSIQLKQGWNLLGVHSFENVKQVDYLKNIEGKYARLWEYDPSLKTINPISITDVGEFMPSKAYWIYMNEPGVVLP